VVLVTPRLAAHAFLPFDLLKGTLNDRPPRPVDRHQEAPDFPEAT
jgi:hypothetical protein